MSLSFSKMLHFYYLTVLVLILSALGFGGHFYWNHGAANVENISSVFEATIQIDELKKKNDVGQIRSLVLSDRVREANRRLDILIKDIDALNKVESVSEYKSLKGSINETKKSLNKLISYPELKNIFLVFNSKVSSFENYVVSRNWRTLTRMSRRVKAQISPSRVSSPGFFKAEVLSKLLRVVKKEISVMESVTENSVLSRQDKNIVMAKLRTLKTEVRMLDRYVESLRKFFSNYSVFDQSYKKWFSKVGPEISFRRLSLEKNAQLTLMFLVCVVSFVLIAVGFGFFLYGLSKKKNKKKVESIVLESIKNGVVPVESKIEGQFSEEFDTELEKYREYVHKRMSFGSIFQDAMPFSSLLLDSNLNLVWANSLFYEHWDMEKKTDGKITWDFLQRFTNLGENDPVLSALNDGVAGIYNIQVKNSLKENALPYEMYVSPVEYASQKRIMIFFYPLRSIEETLNNQSRSLISPVVKTLDALSSGHFTQDTQDRIQKDFTIAGTEDVFEKFMHYNKIMQDQKMALDLEIEKLENALYDQFKLSEDANEICLEQEGVQRELIDHLKKTKESVISLVSQRSEVEELFNNTIKTSQSLFQDEMTLLSHTGDLAEMIDENKKAFENVIKTKDEFKSLKNNVEQFKTKIMQMINQLMISRKSDSDQSKVDHALSKMKLEMQSFEKNLATLGQISTALDVGLSKMQLIMSKSDSPDLTQLKDSFNSARDVLEKDLFEANRLSRVGQMKDEEIIKSIKGLYHCFKDEREKLGQVKSLRDMAISHKNAHEHQAPMV